MSSWSASRHVRRIGLCLDTHATRLRSCSKIPGLVPLPHMLTTAPHTAVAVPSMVSLQPIERWSAVLAQKSIVEAFNEVGFKTYWLSAQAADSWAGLIPQIAAEATRRRYFDSGYDGALLDEFRSILAHANADEKLFIVLHTKGSHFEYARRYPPGFSRFETSPPTRRQLLVDEYDNSIVYTDWFLSTAIAQLAQQQARIRFCSTRPIMAKTCSTMNSNSSVTPWGRATTLPPPPSSGYRRTSCGLAQISFARFAPMPRPSSACRISRIRFSMSAGIEAKDLDRRQSIFSNQFTPMPRFLHGARRVARRTRLAAIQPELVK